jgi:hypothetical protein
MNIKELAEQAGLLYMDYIRINTIKDIERFADLVAAHEREECAKIAEAEDVEPTDDAVCVQGCIIQAIRARSKA